MIHTPIYFRITLLSVGQQCGWPAASEVTLKSYGLNRPLPNHNKKQQSANLCIILGMYCVLTHWGRVTHLCISKLTSIASDNGLSPGWCQAIIWTKAGIWLIRPIRTNFSEILSKIHTFSFNKMRLKMSSGKWRPFCLGLNELNRTE